MKHIPLKLALSALVLGIIFDMLLYKVFHLGINVLLMQIAFLAVLGALVYFSKIKLPHRAIVSGVFSLLFAATFAIWTSEVSLVLNFLGLIAANILTVLFVWGHHGRFTHPVNVFTDTVVHGVRALISKFLMLGHIRLPFVNDKYSSVIRGVIISVPILVIFFVLFLSSDLALQHQTSALGDWLRTSFEISTIVSHAFIIGFFTFVFLIIFAAAFWRRSKFKLTELRTHSRVESSVILVLSNVLFLAFILFQAFYLFGGRSAWDQIEDMTYSEYAVSGFGELAWVAILVVLLILTLRYFHGVKTKKKLLHIAEIGLIVQTIAIVASASMRMHLYVIEYGFTPARLFGFWFFAVTAVVLVLLGAHIYKKIDQYKYIQQALIILGIAILIFTALTPDALSVRLNVSRAQEAGNLDPFPLFHSLSAEAYGVMDEVLTNYKDEIGVMDTAIEDYCPFVRSHYRDDKVINFTLIVEQEKDADLAADVIVRREIARFYNEWTSTADEDDAWHFRNQGWQSWNLARSFLPDKTHESIDSNGIPYPADEIAKACGWFVGDAR